MCGKHIVETVAAWSEVEQRTERIRTIAHRIIYKAQPIDGLPVDSGFKCMHYTEDDETNGMWLCLYDCNRYEEAL